MEIERALHQAVKSGFSLPGIDECNSGGILGFEMPLFSKFLQDKTLKGDFWKDERYNDDSFRDGLSLIARVDVQDDFWDYERPKNLDHFLSHIYLAYYSSAPQPNLALVSPLSLFDILPIYSDHFLNMEVDHLQNLAGKKCKPDVKGKTVDWLRKEKNLSGRVYVCDYKGNGFYCGEPLCASDFAWIKNGVALFYMHTGGDFITSAWIYPFVTDLHYKP